MSLIKEIGDFYRFMWRTPARQKEIVFYSEGAGYYAFYEGLIDELVNVRNQHISYVTSDLQDPIFNDPRPGLHAYYIDSLIPYFTMMFKCKVFVMTLTELHKYHFKRSSYPAHYAYVFHSLVSTHMMYRDGSFDHYDSILCVGPHHVSEITEYEKLKQTPGKELVEAGYFRLERIYAEYQKLKKLEAANSTNKTILIAPSWGEQNLLKSCGLDLVKPLLDAGYKIIVRPHPETGKREPELLTRFDQAFGSHPKFFMERSVRTDDSLLEADLMICDLSGVALEYALGTERPVLFVDVPPKIQNPDYTQLSNQPIELSQREQMGELMPLADLPQVAEKVSHMLANADQHRDRLVALRGKLVFEFGNSSVIGADHILKML